MSVLESFRLDGKVAVLNGAGRGIGAASALALAEAGADVAVLSRTKSQIDEVAEQIRAMGRRAVAIECDAMNSDAVTAAIDQAASELGRIDIAVNVVGGAMPGPYTRASDAALADAWDRNVTTGVRVVRAAVPHMLKVGGGSIIMISSAIGHLAGRGYAMYGSIKAAVDHSVRQLSLELNPKIRVNAVAPGAILTEALATVMTNDDIRKGLENGTPLRRVGLPEDIAAAVLYLASPASSYVTGQIIPVDGGLVAPNLPLPLPDL